ncbi:MAG TPA: hypothetical protein VMR96_05805 [Solirubrobacterales bacterium]|nr:hypothetical protein [Solirubrobacterales bacterium]
MKLKTVLAPVVGAALLGLGVSACKDYGSIGERDNAPSAAKADQKQAEDSFAKASDAQKKAGREQDQAAKADKDVDKARADLANKEQKADQQKTEASQAQANATAQGQQAAATVPATTSTNSGGSPAIETSGATGSEQTVSGKLAQARADSITLDASGQPQQLKVDAKTTVMLDGKPASAAQLQQGSDVRASFRVEGTDQRATRIDATSKPAATGSTDPAPPPLAQPNTPAQPQPSPAPSDSPSGNTNGAQPGQPTSPVSR